jgi:hypothetical protein
MMSTTGQKPATTPIPVQLSEPEFDAFILPHLSMPKRGPKCKLGYHRVFNLILWVLYTGMQWKCLPVPKDPHGKPAIHYSYCSRADYQSAHEPSRASVSILAADLSPLSVCSYSHRDSKPIALALIRERLSNITPLIGDNKRD